MSPPRRRPGRPNPKPRRPAPPRQHAQPRRPSPPRRHAKPQPGRQAPPRGLGGQQVEGRQAVRELLLAGRRKVYEVWMAGDLDPAPVLDDIRELAADARVPITTVSRSKLEAETRTDAPQGVLAKAAELTEVDLDDLASSTTGGPPPFLLVLDGITDPGNLGAVLRSAEGAGASGVVLPRHRAVHVTPSVTKSAAGAIEYLPMALVGGIPAALARLRERSLWIVGLDEAAASTVWEMAGTTDPLALVLGAEGRGLGRLTRRRCDQVVSIPQLGRIGSLNVAAAGALACYEVARARVTPSD